MLRTNIRFSVVDQELRSLVVTSPAPSEGKSTTAANLAIVLAQSGQKTILVDADLRRPVQHSIFQLPNKQGLTTALIERNVSVKRYLQEVGVEDLRVLTSGPQPPNPAELLGSQRMRDLLSELEEEADLVIVDMPPVLAVTDSSLVAGAASGVLLVLRANVTTFAAAQKAVDQLRSVHARILGIVLNGVQSGTDGYYYYYYPTEGNSDERKKGAATLGAKMRALMLNVMPRRG
jgi:protein-tyrosine kinase